MDEVFDDTGCALADKDEAEETFAEPKAEETEETADEEVDEEEEEAADDDDDAVAVAECRNADVDVVINDSGRAELEIDEAIDACKL
jgi:hypothetical protein